MEMVSAARLRRAEQRIEELRPYAEGIRRMTRRASEAAESIPNLPVLQEREQVQNVGILLITSDRGLAGAFNSQINRAGNTRVVLNTRRSPARNTRGRSRTTRSSTRRGSSRPTTISRALSRGSAGRSAASAAAASKSSGSVAPSSSCCRLTSTGGGVSASEPSAQRSAAWSSARRRPLPCRLKHPNLGHSRRLLLPEAQARRADPAAARKGTHKSHRAEIR